MTDGAILVGRAGDRNVELKHFDIADSIGIRLLQKRGIKVTIVSGRHSEATTIRAAELGIEDVVQDDGANKLPALRGIMNRAGVEWDAVAFVGDDLPDIPVLRRVGVPVAVGNAVPEVMAVTPYVTTARGGHGAVREFAEALLKARGEWDDAVRQYLSERGETTVEATRS